MPTERRVEFMRLQNRRPCLLPNLPVDLGGKRPSIVENEYRVLKAETAPDGLLLQDHRQLTADGNTPYGARTVRILLAALLSLRVDQEPTGAVFCEFHLSNTQRQGFLRAQPRESDGGQEGPQNEAALWLFASPVQDREALPIGKMKRSFTNNCGHGKAP